MPMSTWTPGEITELDQALAAQDRKLTALTEGYQEQAAESGENQALANIALALTMISGEEVTAMVLAAVRRLAREPGSPV